MSLPKSKVFAIERGGTRPSAISAQSSWGKKQLTLSILLGEDQEAGKWG
jgi:hypothetical protein